MSEQPELYFPERALCIFAHADDIEFGAAGTMMRWTDSGVQVSYCIVTDNSSGSNAPDVDLPTLIATRREEALAAAATAGVHDVRFLNYQDGTLTPTLDLRRDLTRIIREIRPQVVVTFDPTVILVDEAGYINHPDHRATGEAALYAVFPSSETRPIFPELLAEGLEPHKVNYLYLGLTDKPNLIVDITSVMDRKVAALLCHASQVGEDDMKFVREWNGEMGKPAGYDYAEAYRVMKLNDPNPPDESATDGA
jgi:LmbE family N-acetylglucosaminyl deacetylase